MKNLLVTVVAQLLMGIVAYAQLEIETSVPTGFDEAINVGVGVGYFETMVRNQGASVVKIEGIRVEQSHAKGLEIVSASYSYNGGTTDAIVSDNVISPQRGIRLLPGSQIVFSYTKRATCEMVPDASSGYSVQVVDEITVLCTEGNGATTSSNSYPVLFPGLSVVVPESPYNNVDVEYLENYTDEVVIRNEQNSGKVSAMTLHVEWAQVGALEINGVKLNDISFEFVSKANAIEIELNSEDLKNIGYSDGMMPSGSQFTLGIEGRVKKYFASMLVKYSVDYKSFGEICLRQTNAEGIKYYRQKYPDPQIEITENVLSKGDFCGGKLQVEYIVSNIGTNNPSNYLFDTYLDLSSSNSNFAIESVECNGVPLTKKSSNYPLNCLTDFDGDNDNADYDGKSSLKIKVTATPLINSSYKEYRLYLKFKGKKITGDEFSTSGGFSEKIENVTSYALGDATLDEKIKPIGNVKFGYSYTSRLENHFMDYRILYKNPKGGTVQLPITSTSDFITEEIRACENDILKYQLVLQTGGCTDPEKEMLLTESIPTTVQRCYASTGGCYEGNVFEASFDRNEINTCDEVDLKAKGTISYICGQSCSRYRAIVVSVEDLSRQLPITIKNPTLDNTVSTTLFPYSANSISYEYTLDDSECADFLENHADESTIISKTLDFSSKLSIKDHTGKDRIDANIQVRYILIGDDDEIYDGTWTWGDMLTVYDPRPGFILLCSLDGCVTPRLDTKMSEGVSESPTREIVITEVEFPKQPDFYYESQGINGVGESTTLENLGIHVKAGETKYSELERILPKCAKNGDGNETKYGTIEYLDFFGTECEEYAYTEMQFISNSPYKMPEITLIPTERQQSISQTTTWTLLMENTGSTTAENVMLRLTPRKENKMTIFILRTNVDGVEIQPIQGNGNTSYITIPQAIHQNGRRTVQIEATYFNCTEDGISYIDVESAWSCESLSPQNFDKFNCGGSTVLELENMVAVLNAVETYPKEYFHLCEDIPIHLNISNIGRADLNQLGFWFDSLLIDKNYSITNNLLHWSYNGRTGFLDNADSYLSANTILSQTILYDDGGSLGGAKSIDFDFNLQLHCGANKRINAINFYVQGYTNCQAEQIKEFQFKPKFKEFQFLDSLSVQATVDNKNFEYGGIRNFTATVQNLSNALIDSAYVTLTYPNDLQYIGYDATRSTGVVDEEIIDNNDGTTTVEWKLQEGIHLAPQEQITVYYQLQAKQLCGKSLDVLTQGTLLRKMRDCDGTECDFKNSTDAVVLTVTTPNPQFSATISETESTCKGNDEIYLVSGVGIESIDWTVSPETIGSITSNGQMANLHYTENGVATISANVVGSCETLHLNAQTTVSDKPNFNITPPDSILWKDWYELGVKAVSTEYAESNWTIPQIDTCGQYTLIYEESNECGSILESVPIEIYRCCEPEKVSMPDTLYLSYSEWGNYTLDSIKATPEGGIWDTLKTEKHGMCGEYKYKYTVTKCDSTATDSIVIIVENCCMENPHGDLVETERAGVTTYDVEVLRQYVKNPSSLIQNTDLYETYTIKMNNCGEEKEIQVIQCFKKWADINEDGKIDETDVELLIQMVR